MFCTSVRTGAALSSPSRPEGEINKGIPFVGIPLFIWYTGRDSNPQPSEPESDALSIEPPVHAFFSQAIITHLFPFVKGKTEKSAPRHSPFFCIVFHCLLWYNDQKIGVYPCAQKLLPGEKLAKIFDF